MIEKDILRGDIFFAELGETIGSVQKGRRPVLIVQNDIGNWFSETLIAAIITSKTNKKSFMPTHVMFKIDCLPQQSCVELEQITTIDRQQLSEFVGTMPDNVMQRIDEALKVSLQL